MSKKIMPVVSLALLACAVPSSVLSVVYMDEAQDTATLLAEIEKTVKDVTSKTQQTAETALAEAKKYGEVSAETKDTADKLLHAQASTNKVMEDLKAKLEGFDTKINDISQHVAEGPSSGSGGPVTMGHAAMEHREKVQAFVEGGLSGALSIDVSNAITSADGSGGGLIYREEERDPINMPRRQLLIADLVSHAKTNTDLIPYRRQVLRDQAAASIAETGAYPEAAFGWDKAETKVRKIGVITHVSEDVLKDADLLQSEIDVELSYDVELERERQILAGDGVGENLEGLLTVATDFVAANGLPNTTRIDRLRLAFLQVTLADYYASSVVLNPTDWTGIDTAKDANGGYIFGNPHGIAGPVIWGRAVAQSNTMGIGEWLAGDFKRAATLYSRQQLELILSKEHDTNFGEDLVSIKARLRAALAIKRATAMVKGDFTFA